jgi:hypothetical protein
MGSDLSAKEQKRGARITHRLSQIADKTPEGVLPLLVEHAGFFHELSAVNGPRPRL